MVQGLATARRFASVTGKTSMGMHCMSAALQKLPSSFDAANRAAAERILANVAKYGEGSAMVIWARMILGRQDAGK